SEVSPDSQNLLKIGSPFENPIASPSTPLRPPTLLEFSSFGRLLLIYGDYENESGQESIQVWHSFFEELGFDCSTTHISSLPSTNNYDLLVAIPNVGTSDMTYGVSSIQAQSIANQTKPVLLLGYAHEILDILEGFDPFTDFIPCVERFLWSLDPSLQIFSLPHEIPVTSTQHDIYVDHVSYDAYRISSLPSKVEVLATNFDGSGSQILWYRAFGGQPFLYYWGIDQVNHLNTHGIAFCENFLHWLIRPVLQERIGQTLSTFQLDLPSSENYWAVQGAGGFGLPLEPSIIFTYYVTDLVKSFDLDVDITAFSEWLKSQYNSVLGYFEDLASPQHQDRCVTTGMSVLVANALGILDQIDAEVIGNYLASCQDSNTGGFFTEFGALQTSLRATRYGIEGLLTLGQLNKINSTAVISYINDCQESNPFNSEFGGFYSSKTGEVVASLVHTTDAIVTLSHLDAVNTINQPALVTFLSKCEEPRGSGIFDTKQTMDSDEWIQGTACAIQVLNILNNLSSFNISNGRTFILANQFANGGWGRGDSAHDFHNSPDETWWAVQGLALTGGLGLTGAGLTQYLEACCSGWGGATEPVLFGDFLSSAQILSALYYTDNMNSINLTAYLQYLDNCWSVARTSFSSHQSPPTVGINTDTPTPDRITIELGTFGPLYHYEYAKLSTFLNLTGSPWSTRKTQILQEIIDSQTFALGYEGMFGLHHLYVGRETDFTFRFDSTCWSLLAHQILDGQPSELTNATATLIYLLNCLQGNSTHQYFFDPLHNTPLPAPFRFAEGNLAETWLGLQALYYLDPTSDAINGQRIATYASQYLQQNPDLITAYYASEILNLLTDTGLFPEARTLINQTTLKSLLLNAITYSGLFTDPTIPKGKWTSFLTSLGLQLINHLHFLPLVDVNPLLNLSNILIPTGVLQINSKGFFSGIVNETRWGCLPTNVSVTAHIFDMSFSNSCNPSSPHLWEVQYSIPSTPQALGPQNLTLVATAHRSIPYYHELQNICEVWGNITIQPTYSPGLNIPRSIPLNISIHLTLDGESEPYFPLTTGFITIAIETTPDIYYLSHYGDGRYETVVFTNSLFPQNYTLIINATAPYCVLNTTYSILSIQMFNTYLTPEPATPLIPILYESVSVHIALRNTSGTPLQGYQISFNITRPGDIFPSLQRNEITNISGIATCQWQPNRLGEWQIVCFFEEQEMYRASNSSVTVTINRRPIQCTIQLFPTATLFIGNQSLIQIQVTDKINGSSLPNLFISLYEGEHLIATATTNETGQATCQWLITAPVGFRSLHLEIIETPVYEHSIITDISYHIMDTTTIEIASNTSTLFIGESLDFYVRVFPTASGPPNGTASIFWDGHWHHDISISLGVGTTMLLIANSELPGEHLLSVLFGHLETPDMYADSSLGVSITVIQQKTSTLTITIDPLEVDNYFLTPTIYIDIRLTYIEDSNRYDLSALISVELLGQNSEPIFHLNFTTDDHGRYLLVLSTPPPGVYTLRVNFYGQRGVTPCTQTMPFLVRFPINPALGFFTPLIVISITIILIDTVVGILLFTRFRYRIKQLAQHFLTRQTVTESSESQDNSD
ncbi:MAG: hypothetical protein ACFFD8_07420, partial [Candidatus Thorarchaeota archaeon]